MVTGDAADPGMAKDEITLPDGRHLIYYTFPAAESDDSSETDGDGPSAA